VSFIDHLIIIQQEQRCAAYGVAQQLTKLRQQFYNLSSIGTHADTLDYHIRTPYGDIGITTFSFVGMNEGCSLTANQHAVLKCMWQQKVSVI